jgi:hypothetical protein
MALILLMSINLNNENYSGSEKTKRDKKAPEEMRWLRIEV